jgi:hypothetical protein
MDGPIGRGPKNKEVGRMKFPIVVRSAVLVHLLACGCGASADPQDSADEAVGSETAELRAPRTVIKLGVLDDPGTTPLYGAAARLAAAQMNEALGRLHSGIRFELVFGDDHANTPALARSEALRLLNDEHVLGIVSDSSGDTIQLNRLNYDATNPAPYKFPVICYQCSSGLLNNPAATDADPITQSALRDADNWLFRIFYNANFEAKVIDQIVLAKPNLGDRNQDGLLKLAVYADGGHTSLANALGPTLASYYGGATSVETLFLSTQANMPAEWLRVVDGSNETTGVADGEPDYVVMAMLPVNVTAAVQAYRAGGFSLPVISNNSFRRNYILPLVGPGANGLEGSSVALANDNLSGQLFVQAFKAANAGQGPEQTSSGAYDATVSLMLASLVAARAVHGAAQVTPADVRGALTKINEPHGVKIRPAITSFAAAGLLAFAGVPINYDGAYNADDWDAAGDIFPPLVHWTVENGAFVEHESYLCNPQNPLCPVQ